jgi:hypothetical protein
MMKSTTFAWLAAGVFFFHITAFAAEISVRTGFSHQSWSSDKDESGSQLYIPIQLQSEGERLSLNLTAGYAATSGELSGASDRSISGMLDTQAGAAYLLPAWGGLDWLVGLDLNLPTGQTGQDERDVRVMIDPDLVDIVSPGQGFNINPTLSAARQWDRWRVGLGLGYAFQGQYDYSDQTREYDPGDIFSAAAQAEYDFARAWNFGLQAQYLTMGMDQAEGEDLQQKGDTWMVGTALKRSEKTWDLGLSLQGIFRGKAKIKDSSGALATEARNSQGDEYVATLNGRYQWRPQTGFTAELTYLYLTENDYGGSSVYYMGERRKISLALGWRQQLGDTLDLHCTAGGFTMDDEPNWMHPDEERRFRGWSFGAYLAKRF